MNAVFDKMLELPKPKVGTDEDPLQILVANIDFDDFKGKLGIGRVAAGKIKVGENVGFTRPDADVKTGAASGWRLAAGGLRLALNGVDTL